MTARVQKLLFEQARIAVTADGEVTSGYDAIEYGPSFDAVEVYGVDPDDVWTTAERLALADAMMDRWRAYRDKVETHG